MVEAWVVVLFISIQSFSKASANDNNIKNMSQYRVFCDHACVKIHVWEINWVGLWTIDLYVTLLYKSTVFITLLENLNAQEGINDCNGVSFATSLHCSVLFMSLYFDAQMW